jgi:hypothetical protein
MPILHTVPLRVRPQTDAPKSEIDGTISNVPVSQNTLPNVITALYQVLDSVRWRNHPHRYDEWHKRECVDQFLAEFRETELIAICTKRNLSETDFDRRLGVNFFINWLREIQSEIETAGKDRRGTPRLNDEYLGLTSHCIQSMRTELVSGGNAWIIQDDSLKRFYRRHIRRTCRIMPKRIDAFLGMYGRSLGRRSSDSIRSAREAIVESTREVELERGFEKSLTASRLLALAIEHQCKRAV